MALFTIIVDKPGCDETILMHLLWGDDVHAINPRTGEETTIVMDELPDDEIMWPIAREMLKAIGIETSPLANIVGSGCPPLGRPKKKQEPHPIFGVDITDEFS